MRLNSRYAVCLFALIFAYGCSQKGSNVKLEISNNFVFGGPNTAAIAGGGLMVWGQSSQGGSFAKALADKDEINVPLPNGSWTFYAMAWDGTSNYSNSPATNKVFGGVVRCAQSTVLLAGDAVSVNLTVNNANCNDPVFAGTIGATGSPGDLKLPTTRFNFCRGAGLITGPSQLCSDSHLDNRQRVRKSTVGSFRVKLRNHLSLGGGKNLGDGGLTGECVPFAGDQDLPTGETLSHASKYGRATITVPGLPAGGAGLPFHATVEMFLTSDCDLDPTNARGVFQKELPGGITDQDNISNKYFVDGTYHRQYLTLLADKVCEGRVSTTLGGHPFAGGDGTQNNPYIICSVPQFHAINSNPAYFSAHFKLSADLDFNPYSNGLSTATLPPEFNCLDVGSNFMPIGYDSATCNQGTKVMTWGGQTAFSGTFNGGNFRIKNLRLRAESLDHVGMFASIMGSQLDVGNFFIDHAEISGSNYVGALAGEIMGISPTPTEILLWSIVGNNLDIEARGSAPQSMVGGLVGSFENGNMFRINLHKSKVRGEGSQVGGVLGSALRINLVEVGAEVDIDNNSALSNKVDVGGVVGRSTSTNFNYVKHEGGIYTNSHQVGGIVGSTLGDSSLQHFYTMSNIVTISGDVNPKLGGVVGLWGSDIPTTIGPGYSLSKVKSNCTTSCQHGGIVGNISVSQPATQLAIYRLSTQEAGDGGAGTTFSTGETTLSLADMRSVSQINVLSSAPNTIGAYNWAIMDGEYPRFDFETHPCVTTGVSGSGAGTIVSPKNICNETQYLAMSSATSASYYKLLSNIRFTINSPSNDIAVFNGHLNGNGHSLIGGGITMNGDSGLGHIGTLNGSIRNLKVHGMSRAGNAGSPATPHGTFVATNNGTLENIRLNTYSTFYDKGAGVVGHNTLTGIMRNIKFDGVVKGYDGLATLVYKNEGLIEHSRANGEIVCIHPTVCNYLAGIAVQNQGRIKRTTMSAHISELGPGMASNVSMLVDTNEMTGALFPGILEDIYVPEYAEIKVRGSNIHYFHRQNLNGASLNRIANFGQLLYGGSMSYGDISSVATNFPTNISSLDQGSGTHTDVRRAGGRSGMRLLYNVPISCTLPGTVRIPAFASLDSGNWTNAFDSGAYSSFTPGDKKIIIEMKFNMGLSVTQRAIAYDPSVGEDFDIPTSQCYGPGTATVYYSNDIPFDNSNNDLAGLLLRQSASLPGTYGPAWQAVMYDNNNPSDLSALLSYYGYMLGVSTTPVTPRIWELSEDNVELFEDHD